VYHQSSILARRLQQFARVLKLATVHRTDAVCTVTDQLPGAPDCGIANIAAALQLGTNVVNDVAQLVQVRAPLLVTERKPAFGG
jgi:hypothetical protein